MFKLLVFVILICFTMGVYPMCPKDSIIPTQDTITIARRVILAIINSEQIKTEAGIEYPFLAGFVRLAFHDCVGHGGCDGCINHKLEDNAGLRKYTFALNSAYLTNGFTKKISRADFYALAAVVALEKATEFSNDKFTGGSRMLYGRKDCFSSPDEDVDNNLPNSLHSIDDTLKYFAVEFGFNAKQVTALLGAHTLGRTHIENSVYEGRWVRESTTKGPNPASVLDNEYYLEILRPWAQVDITFHGTTKAQWQDPNTEPNDKDSRNDPNQLPMLLNSDFCLALNFSIIDAVGHIGCDLCPPDGPRMTAGDPACCALSPTSTLVIEYANNNAKWLSDFTDVFMLMISRNGNNKLSHASMDATQDEIFRDEIRELLDEVIGDRKFD